MPLKREWDTHVNPSFALDGTEVLFDIETQEWNVDNEGGGSVALRKEVSGLKTERDDLEVAVKDLKMENIELRDTNDLMRSKIEALVHLVGRHVPKHPPVTALQLTPFSRAVILLLSWRQQERILITWKSTVTITEPHVFH